MDKLYYKVAKLSCHLIERKFISVEHFNITIQNKIELPDSSSTL